MTSQLTRRPAHVRHLGAAAAVAAAALLAITTSTVADPSTAGAKPKFDRDGYEKCVDDAIRVAGNFEEQTRLLKSCCEFYGGEWLEDLETGVENCYLPPEAGAGSPGQVPWPSQQLPQLPPGQTEATRPPAPPAGPILQTPPPPAQQQAPR